MAQKVARAGWQFIGVVSAFMAAKTARKALDRGWRSLGRGAPPANPASPTTTWAEAVAWAVASGVAVGLARLVAARGAAAAWRKTMGSLPPGLEEVQP